jgi:hypothetical protein
MATEQQEAEAQAHRRKHPDHRVAVTFGGWTCVGSVDEDCEIGGEIQT